MANSWTLFRKMTKFLKYCTIVTWRAWFHALPAKSSKGFCFQTMRRVDSRSSCCNSPCEALHVGASSIALQPLVLDVRNYRHTNTHTHRIRILIINIIDDQVPVYADIQGKQETDINACWCHITINWILMFWWTAIIVCPVNIANKLYMLYEVCVCLCLHLVILTAKVQTRSVLLVGIDVWNTT